MVTVDQGIQHQQNMGGRKIAVIFLQALKNDIPTLTPMAKLVLAQLDDIEPGGVLTIQHPDWR